MTAAQLPTSKEIIALLSQNGVRMEDKDAFVKAFKHYFPTLSARDRADLIAEILAYVDSTLVPGHLPTSA